MHPDVHAQMKERLTDEQIRDVRAENRERITTAKIRRLRIFAVGVAGERMRDGSPDAQAALSRQGRYQTVRDNLRVKEVHIGEGDAAKRFIICHNPAEAEREKTGREDTIHRLEAELDRIETQRAKANSAKAAEAHTRAECALRDHPSLGRYLRQPPSGRLRIDRAKIAAEERLDGKFLLPTSDPDLSAEDVALGYKLGGCAVPHVVFPGNAGSSPVEVFESVAPIRMLEKKFITRYRSSDGSHFVGTAHYDLRDALHLRLALTRSARRLVLVQ